MSATFRLSVISQTGELYPCSAWPTRSVATISGSAVLSAKIRLSVGPAIMSNPTFPNKRRFASATNWLPGPTKISAFANPNSPYAIDAIA